mmetsp:Transcript_9664/g.16249  ORF Transcript_9664/g.16249 Transcript_9664/m.16249 type:complete len:84 (-) Transcript_9664:27-278(-)
MMNGILEQLNFMQQDIKTQLGEDEKKLEKIGKDFDEAAGNTDSAQEQLNKKNAKLRKQFRRYMGCFLLLFVLVSLIFARTIMV